MRAQLRLLEYLVHMRNMDQQLFHMGFHTLTLDIEDIYFLTGISWRGYHASLTAGHGGGLPVSEYFTGTVFSRKKEERERFLFGGSKTRPCKPFFSL